VFTVDLDQRIFLEFREEFICGKSLGRDLRARTLNKPVAHIHLHSRRVKVPLELARGVTEWTRRLSEAHFVERAMTRIVVSLMQVTMFLVATLDALAQTAPAKPATSQAGKPTPGAKLK